MAERFGDAIRRFCGRQATGFQRMIPVAIHRAEIVNTYGPTECSDIATFHRLSSSLDYGGRPVPIGRPICNVQVYIVDVRLAPVPSGVVGELCIAGAGVGAGSGSIFSESIWPAFITLPTTVPRSCREGHSRLYFCAIPRDFSTE